MKYLFIVLMLFGSVAHADRPWGDGGRPTVPGLAVGHGGEGGQGGNGYGGRGGAGGEGGSAWGGAGGSSDQQQQQQQDASSQNTNSYYEKNNYKDTYREYVAPAYAPPLAATGDCLGSASAGGSNSVMGFSIGKTYVDEDCNARRDSAHLWSMGRTQAAVMRLCSQPEMAKVLPECPEPEEVNITWD